MKDKFYCEEEIKEEVTKKETYDDPGRNTTEKLSYIDLNNKNTMVEKEEKREEIEEVACGSIYMKRSTMEKIESGNIIKGDVFTVAQVAGITAAKNTGYGLPMCCPNLVGLCDITFNMDYDENKIGIIATAKAKGEVRVEMEALNAVTTAALTIYDMCKSVDKTMVISDIKLLRRIGRKPGEFIRV